MINLENYLIPAEEGFISKLKEMKVNKEKLKELKAELSKENPETVAAKFITIAKDVLVAGPEGNEVVKTSLEVMQDADKTLSNKEREGLTSFDMSLKNINGITVAILPDSKNPYSGVSMLIVPVKHKSGKAVEGVILGNEIAKAIMNPNRKLQF